jgi:hypothetical protein
MVRVCVKVFMWSHICNSWLCVRAFFGRRAMPSARQFLEDHGGGHCYRMVRWRLPTSFWERIAWSLRREIMRLDRAEAQIRVQRWGVRHTLARVSMARQRDPPARLH